MEIKVPAPALDSSNGEIKLATYRQQLRNGDPLAPLVFALKLSKGARLSVVSHDDAIYTSENLILESTETNDIAEDGHSSQSLIHKSKSVFEHVGIGTVRTDFVGIMRAASISRITVGAFDQTGAHSFRYAKRIVITITETSPITFSSLTDVGEPLRASNTVFKSRQAAASLTKSKSALSADDVRQSPGIQSDDGHVYRMVVQTSGIYHIDFNDLKQFNIDPRSVDPKTLRIVNKGQQVPVYVFDHQDGTFDENDYFEFYGEEKRYSGPGTLGDFYYDPDTKDNVYFLVWGNKGSPIPSGGLKRMVEESSEIREANKKKFTDLFDSSFRTTIHYEQDQEWDPLDVSDVNQRSNLRDHFFYKIIRGGDVWNQQIFAPYPDVRSNRSITIRAALHGISHFDPGSQDSKGVPYPDIPNEHEAEISLNGSSILAGIWDSQQPKFLSTDTASQRTALSPTASLLAVPNDSVGGVRPLTITVNNHKLANGVYVRFGVNWFEITYDRLYIAYQNQLSFRAPQRGSEGLYQFTLRNFSSTDISIYRKGVSKLSNYVINVDPIKNTASVILQTNVTGNSDEFIAVVDKLKPVRFEQDDYLNLRDPANLGAYMIITSKDHLRKGNANLSTIPCEDLLAYRKAHNVISGKLIDVANIYDEFSGGSRSPEAIKAFLKYAYDRWREAPKYVLFVGVTRGDGVYVQQSVDQVPSPYIQAYLEGAVAADTWYSLLDGVDLVPDIVIGRLASRFVTDDDAYVQKVKEFEADKAVPGDWKDRALYIGVAAFNGQIDTLLSASIPKSIFAARLELASIDAYYGTDQTFVDLVNKGLSTICYFGHGGNGVWADPLNDGTRPFFLDEDVQRLKNIGRYPCIFSLTCFTAGFDGAQSGGLLSAFNSARNAGSIGGFGTTGFGWQNNDLLMAFHVMPHVYDTLPGTFAERILAGKLEFYLEAAYGDLIPATLDLAYQYLGDPLVSPFEPSDHLSLVLSTRSIQPGSSVTVTGNTSIQTGKATVELCTTANGPLVPPHRIENIPIKNGTFSIQDQIPSNITHTGNYRAVAYRDGDNTWAPAAADVTYTIARVTELDYEPHPLPAQTDIQFSASAQSPIAIDSVIASLQVVRTDAQGVRSYRNFRFRMSLVADRYTVGISAFAQNLIAGDQLTTRAIAYSGNVSTISDSIVATIGASADPSAYRDPNHRALAGSYKTTPQGLVWRENVFNWGSAPTDLQVSLVDAYRTPSVSVGSVNVSSLAPHSSRSVDIPVHPLSLDSVAFMVAVLPTDGQSSLSLRDSSTQNDTTNSLIYQPAAVGYLKSTGGTFDGASSASLHLNSDEVVLQVPPGAEANAATDVIRIWRQYPPATTVQPDVHFLRQFTDKARAYGSLRIVSDSLGAIPLSPNAPATLTIKLNTSDSVIKVHNADNLFIYRQDDRSKLWSQLKTTRTGDQLSATVTSLGNFAIAYTTDVKSPTVDITVEGQVFSNNGEVPPQPHIHAVIQDANGIDVTPGKTLVKVDNRLLDPSEYVILDSGRTPTTINLRMEPSLGSGNHAITIQATDDNGHTNTPPKELDVHVSNDFSVNTLGSYPNPFTRDYMFVAYEIRGIAFASDVELDIYTVSGKRIRTLNYPSDDPTRAYGFLKGGTGVPTSLGYHEVWYDGRDDNGETIANGVYFYRLRVKTAADERIVKGKFARVR